MFHPECHRCQEGYVPDDAVGMNYYTLNATMQGGEHIVLRYNVSAAFGYAKRSRTPSEVPLEVAKELIFVNLSETFCGAHVDHVDRGIPAIIGTCGRKLMLLDGTHRMFARLKNAEAPLAYVLNETETAMFEIHNHSLVVEEGKVR